MIPFPRCLLKFCRTLCASMLIMALLSQSALASVPSDWRRVQNLEGGSQIFVKMKTGEKYKGELSEVTADSLVLYAYQHGILSGRDVYRVVLQREEVKEVQMVSRDLSALAGGAIGAGVGAGIGAGIDTATARDHEFRGTVALVMGLLGALIGSVVGRSTGFVKGEKIYRAA